MVETRILPAIVVVTALAIAGSRVMEVREATPEPVGTMNGPYLSFRDDEHALSLAVERQSRVKRLVAAAWQPMRGGLPMTFGTVTLLAALTPADAKTFEVTYPGSRECSAGFFMARALHYRLYAANPEIAAQLAAFRRSTYSDVGRWEDVALAGRCITGVRSWIDKGVDYGSDIDLSVGQTDPECPAMVVERIDIRPHRPHSAS